MPDVANLGIQITADDRASKTLEDVQSRLRLTESAMDGLSVTTVAKGGLIVGALLAVGTAAAKMAEQGVRAAADLEHSVANISTIKPDVDTSALFKSLNNLQTQVPQTAKQLGDSLYDVFSSIDNVTEEQGLKLVETFAKGATAAQTDAKTFGTAISGVLNAYKLDTSEAAKVSDVFFNTVNRGVVTGQQLAAGLGPAIAAAKALGVSYEEAFALIVGATKEGGDAAQNINNITNLFSKLPTKEATADLNALGIATQTAAGALRSPVAVLTDLKAKLDTMSEAARATTLLTIFPDLQARQGAQVIMSQLATVNTALAENRTATNSTAEAYAKMSATAVEQGKLLANTWSALLTDLGAVTLPALVGALGLVGAGVRTLREDFQETGAAIGEASTTIQTKTEEIKGDLDTLTTYADTNLRPKWDAFWKAATGGNYPAPQLPAPPEGPQVTPAVPGVTPNGYTGLVSPSTPLESGAYIQGLTPAPLEQTRSPFGGSGAGHLSPEESGLGPLGNIRGQFENVLEDMAASNAAHAAAMADTLATDYSAQLLRRKPAMHEAGVELGEAVAEGVETAVAEAAPAARSAALIEQDLADARKRTQDAALGGAVAIREHTEALAREHEQALGGALAIRDHADALERERTANLGGALSIRDHAEALTREHEQALGGALAIRDHADALAREQEANLGGAVAIRDHDEALAREKEAALGGAVAVRDHAEALQRQQEAALGGALAIRDHEEALARDKEANLGGALAIRDHAEALQREHEAALGGVAAIRDHEDALNREKTAALGGEVGLRAHSEALNEEKIAALGGRAAILDHQAALGQLDKAAQQARTVFVDLADKMANYATSTVPAAVAQSLAYKNANEAANGALALLTGTQQAEVKALQNAGDAYGALNHALEEAHVGYQDVQGVLNGEWQAQERLSAAIQRNTQYRRENLQQALTAASNPALLAQQAAIQQALANTGGGGAGGGTGSGGTVLSSGSGGSSSPFASAEFAAWYQANYGSRETFINANATNPAAMATVTSLDSILDRFTNRFMDSYEANQAHERDKLVEALSHVGETLAQQAARLTGAPTPQANVDDLVTQLSRQALTTLERSMTLTQRANLEYTAQLQGPVTALQSLGRAINANVTEDQALAAATKQVTTTNEGVITDQGRLNQVLTEAHQKAFVLGEGMDFAGAAAARAGLAALEEAHNMQVAAMAAQEAAEQWKLAGANAAALMAGALRNAGVAGGVTQVGLTYTQIMSGSPGGGSSGGSNQGNVNLPPGNYYGLPVVSPVTGGSLRGFADGGLVAEPTYLTNARTGRTFGLMAEAGPERIGDGGTTITIQINANGVDALRDDSFWDQAVARQIRPALKRVGVKV